MVGRISSSIKPVEPWARGPESFEPGARLDNWTELESWLVVYQVELSQLNILRSSILARDVDQAF